MYSHRGFHSSTWHARTHTISHKGTKHGRAKSYTRTTVSSHDGTIRSHLIIQQLPFTRRRSEAPTIGLEKRVGRLSRKVTRRQSIKKSTPIDWLSISMSTCNIFRRPAYFLRNAPGDRRIWVAMATKWLWEQPVLARNLGRFQTKGMDWNEWKRTNSIVQKKSLGLNACVPPSCWKLWIFKERYHCIL